MIYSHRIRLICLALVITAGCMVLFYRLWFLQIKNQEEYVKRQPVTRTAKQRVPGTRGRIFDRNRVEFAGNETNMEIGLNLAAVEAAWKEKHHVELRKNKLKMPTFSYGVRAEETTDIIALLNEMVFPELNRLKLYRDFSNEKQKEKQKTAIIRHYLTNKGVIPFPYEKNLLQNDEESFKRYVAYAENAPSIPGITLTERPKRRYPLKAMAAHLIGYIQENRDPELLPAEEQQAMAKEDAEAVALGQPKVQRFKEADDFGAAGLEQSMDEKLRPKPGERTWAINEHGRLTDEIESLRREPLPGSDVFLTIDTPIQMIAEMALREAGVGRGAVVVMNPNTGEILAMASVPSYDPSIFIPPKDNAAMTEMFNDPTGSQLPFALRSDLPGSTFKLMTAIAGSMAGLDWKSYNCAGFVSYGHPMQCWINKKGGSHGMLDLADGLKNSCNCYFFQLGNEAGIARIREAASLFGFGTGPDERGSSGIELPPGIEANGYVSTEAYKLSKNQGKWTPSDTANISIGQGLMNASPLQICMLGSAVANGGKIYQPTLIHHFVDHDYDRDGQRRDIISEFKPRLRADLLEHGVKKKDMDNMREGMRRVVNDQRGTGKSAKSEMCIIAGKTGTAQQKRPDKEKKVAVVDNRTLFMSFAPYDAPTLAVSVIVYNGEAGGKSAAPVAKRVIEQTLSMRAGNYRPVVHALEPAKGHFNKIDEVIYPGTNVPDFSGEEETVDDDTDDTTTDTGPAAGMLEPALAPHLPRAEVIPEEDDKKNTIFQKLQPVQFRLKTDPPNPRREPTTAEAR